MRGDAIAMAIAVLAAYVVAAVFAAAWFLFLYGIVLLVFRHAFGVELPNPFDLLPPDWRHKIPMLPYSK